MRTYTATSSAPAPRPCRTRPASNWAMVLAVPATSRPIPNNTGAATSGTRGPARSHQRPPTTVPNTDAAMNDTNGHAYSATAPRSATSAGIAVPTPIASNATRLTSRTNPTVVARLFGPNSSERTATGATGTDTPQGCRLDTGS